ncbi:MAG: hypothetical protein ACI87J_002185 [Colwellia sp.]|jgi:uncharacterized protein involved in copper resistance
MKTNLIKTARKLALVLIPTIAFSMTATAHDPSMHVKKAGKADCSKMDHSKMDMKDPVAIAMMKKCMKQSEADKNSMKNMDHSKMKGMDQSKMEKPEHNANKKDGHNH